MVGIQQTQTEECDRVISPPASLALAAVRESGLGRRLLCDEPCFCLGRDSESARHAEGLFCRYLKHPHHAEKSVAAGQDGTLIKLNPTTNPL